MRIAYAARTNVRCGYMAFCDDVVNGTVTSDSGWNRRPSTSRRARHSPRSFNCRLRHFCKHCKYHFVVVVPFGLSKRHDAYINGNIKQINPIGFRVFFFFFIINRNSWSVSLSAVPCWWGNKLKGSQKNHEERVGPEKRHAKNEIKFVCGLATISIPWLFPFCCLFTCALPTIRCFLLAVCAQMVANDIIHIIRNMTKECWHQRNYIFVPMETGNRKTTPSVQTSASVCFFLFFCFASDVFYLLVFPV